MCPRRYFREQPNCRLYIAGKQDTTAGNEPTAFSHLLCAVYVLPSVKSGHVLLRGEAILMSGPRAMIIAIVIHSHRQPALVPSHRMRNLDHVYWTDKSALFKSFPSALHYSRLETTPSLPVHQSIQTTLDELRGENGQKRHNQIQAVDWSQRARQPMLHRQNR